MFSQESCDLACITITSINKSKTFVKVLLAFNFRNKWELSSDAEHIIKR
jgi:hypothetical protein